jgi:acylphosphatase
VEVIAEGDRHSCEQLLAQLRGGTTPGRVDLVAERWSEPTGTLTGFSER